jgi:AAHS family 4-hydroxybenzoate transporter-like MFS transporter
MLAMGLTMPALFLLVGIPAVLAGGSMMVLGLVRSHDAPVVPAASLAGQHSGTS